MTFDEVKQLSYNHPIIIFDGVCNLCNAFVNHIIRKDKKENFRYTTLQHQQLPEYSQEMDTVFLLENGKLYHHSDVAIQAARQLPFPYNLLRHASLLPKSLRDGLYKFIAKHRYALFGKKDACMIPNKDIRHLFL